MRLHHLFGLAAFYCASGITEAGAASQNPWRVSSSVMAEAQRAIRAADHLLHAQFVLPLSIDERQSCTEGIDHIHRIGTYLHVLDGGVRQEDIQTCSSSDGSGHFEMKGCRLIRRYKNITGAILADLNERCKMHAKLSRRYRAGIPGVAAQDIRFPLNLKAQRHCAMHSEERIRSVLSHIATRNKIFFEFDASGVWLAYLFGKAVETVAEFREWMYAGCYFESCADAPYARAKERACSLIQGHISQVAPVFAGFTEKDFTCPLKIS